MVARRYWNIIVSASLTYLFCCLQVAKEELAKLVQGFDKQEILTSGGVTLAGSRYIYLSGTDRVIRAKLGKVGVHCVKTQQGKIITRLVTLCNRLTFILIVTLYSCHRVYLRRTRSTSTSSFHSWKTGRLFDELWLLEVRRLHSPLPKQKNLQERIS